MEQILVDRGVMLIAWKSSFDIKNLGDSSSRSGQRSSLKDIFEFLKAIQNLAIQNPCGSDTNRSCKRPRIGLSPSECIFIRSGDTSEAQGGFAVSFFARLSLS